MGLTSADVSMRIATPFADVALHRVDLTVGRAVRDGLAALLSTAELDRATTFRVPADRERFVVVRAALRLLLADAGLGPPEWHTIVAGRYGKPELAHPSSVRFSIAHSGDVGLVALADGREVGVDVEEVRPRPDLMDVARRFFAPVEAAALDGLASDAQLAAFHCCWVRKEACVKATGQGLRTPLDQFEVGVAPHATPTIGVALPGEGSPKVACELADVEVGAGYAGAVAVAAAPTR